MKVICVDDTTLSGKKIIGLTVGKIYETIDSSHGVFLIIDDGGYKVWFNDEVLMSLEKWRELQLKELGI